MTNCDKKFVNNMYQLWNYLGHAMVFWTTFIHRRTKEVLQLPKKYNAIAIHEKQTRHYV